MAGGRRVRPAWGALVAVLGLALLWAVGVEAGRYQPAWGEAEPQCVLDGRCSAAEVESTLQLLWTVALAGVVLVLVGVVLGTRSLSRALPESVPPPAHLAHAAIAGLVAGVLAGVFTVPVLASLFSGPQAVPGALLTAWLVPAAVLAAVDHAFGQNSPHRAWLRALALTPLAAVGAAVLLSVAPLPAGSTTTLGAAYGAVVAAGVALVPTGAAAASPPARGGASATGRTGAHVVIALLAVVALVASVAGIQALGEQMAAAPRPGEGVVPEVSDPVEPVPTAPSPTPPPPLPPVEAAEPCAVEDLAFAVGGFDAAMGARGASLQATNISATPCWVEGVPVVTLVQGGRALELAVEPGQAPTGGPAAVQRVGLAPTGSAFALLTWRTYSGWADAETPQAVTAALDPAGPPVEAALPSDVGPAPFDIADGGAWGITPWAPPWN